MSDPLRNHLLSSLPEAEIASLRPKLEKKSFSLGQVLYEAGDRVDHVYFPTTAIISLIYITENGQTAEISVIGNDGLVSVAAYLGGGSMPHQAIVQSAGDGYRISRSDLVEKFEKLTVFRQMLLRFAQALLTQVCQTAVCNRLHPLEQQLCRWLLLCHDRLDSDKLVMTHDMISNMLGVRREGVTLAAQKLAKRNLIVNQRGTITVTDRQGLESAVCECYQVVTNEYNRLLGRGLSRTFG